jgi:hypothetical protein
MALRLASKRISSGSRHLDVSRIRASSQLRRTSFPCSCSAACAAPFPSDGTLSAPLIAGAEISLKTGVDIRRGNV